MHTHNNRLLYAAAAGTVLVLAGGCDNASNSNGPTGSNTTPHANTTSTPSASGTRGANDGVQNGNNSSAGNNAGRAGTTGAGQGGTPAPDNTAQNSANGAGAPTADQQGQSASDVKITADIRQAVMSEKNISVNAQNCKIITNNGAVTLRGPVDTQAEKEMIERKARAVAGVTSVDNQLTVKTTSSR